MYTNQNYTESEQRSLLTKVGWHSRAGQDIVGSELEVKVLLAKQSVHETDELKDELVLTKIITQLEHHLEEDKET